MQSLKAFRAAIIHSLSDTAFAYYPDGLLLVSNGLITACGPADQLLSSLPPSTPVTVFPDSLLLPGLIDTHIHYPQVEVIGSYGTKLLEWLQNYTFPAEGKFNDPIEARRVADFFLKELLRNGTTTALVFCAVYKESVTAFFESAQEMGLRMIAGKVMMDRNAPQYLLDTAESSYTDSKELIQRWHGVDRLLYAVTPRFAITSTEAQLRKAALLRQEFPGVYLHTHLAEDAKEIEFVRTLFPQAKSYLDVYRNCDLVGPRAVFAHSIHLTEEDRGCLAHTGSAISFCPTSNLFLGSGLFNYSATSAHQIRIGLGTDVGGGTSFSMLRTLSEAYKVMQLQGQSLDVAKGLYLATLGGAKALYLDHILGNFETGKEADFCVLDLKATPLLSFRLQTAKSIEEQLFALFTLGDDRMVRATYAQGRCVHTRDR
jgi:guanine deaminase